MVAALFGGETAFAARVGDATGALCLKVDVVAVLETALVVTVEANAGAKD